MSDDLDERVAELERENRELRALVDAQSKKMDRIIELLVGCERDFSEVETDMIENLLDRTERLEENVDEVQTDAGAALARAKTARSDGGSVTKKEIARNTTRNELVRSAIKGWAKSDDGTGLSVGDVQNMAKPQTKLHYQTVKDAWEDLAMDWGAIIVTDAEDGERRAKIKKQAITRELVAVVEDDLGRDDLTKELISRKESGGGSA